MQGLKKFIDFCSQLESCELTIEQPIPKKVSFLDEMVIPKCKRNKSKIEKQISGIWTHYCELHGENPLHNMSECFELNRCKKRAKNFTTIQRSKKQKQRTIPYKDLNAFINAKVEKAFKKRPK